MTVCELIEILKTLPQDHIVVSDGYEDGYDTIIKVKLINVTEKEDKEWYTGRYNYAFNSTDATEVVYLNADNKNEDRFK